jgi:hypothetical protein
MWSKLFTKLQIAGAALILAVGGFLGGVSFGRKSETAPSTQNVLDSREYKTCLATVQSVGMRNTAMRREIEKLKGTK